MLRSASLLLLPCAFVLASVSKDTCSADGGCPKHGGRPVPLWPRARGHLGAYGLANSTGPGSAAELSKPSLEWYPGQTRWHDVVLCGPLIDGDSNLYVTSTWGIHKVTPDGERLWTAQPGEAMVYCPSLGDDSRLFGATQKRMIFALDADTGNVIWRHMLDSMSSDTSYVENHDGVVIAQGICVDAACAGSKAVIALSAESGDRLWQFEPDNPLWNLMAMFPQDGTVLFQDFHSVTYRLGLHNGSLIWKAGGNHSSIQTWTDGGCILGNNGAVYSVSSKAHTINHTPTSGGGVHAYRLSDGHLLWERQMPRPVFTFPVVGRLAGRSDRSVIVAVGANAYFPWNLVALIAGPHLIALGMLMGLLWSLCCCCRGGWCRLAKRLALGSLLGVLASAGAVAIYLSGAVFPLGNFYAEVYALNAETGEQQWVHHLPERKLWYSAGDWEGAMQRLQAVPSRPGCLPAAYNSPTLDAAGTVYIGYMDGMLLALKDADGDGVVAGEEEVSRLQTQSAFLHSGAALVPGLFAVANCDSLYVWKT